MKVSNQDYLRNDCASGSIEKEWKINHYQFRIHLKKGLLRGPHIWSQLEKLKSHFLEFQGRGMLLCQVLQKSFSCVYYLNIHKVIEDDQSKILVQTKNLGWLIFLIARMLHALHLEKGIKSTWVNKINGKKVYETRKYLLWTLNDILDILNRCEVTGIHTKDSCMNEFGRNLSFRQLYELIKANKQYIYNKNISHATCLCEICKNAVFFTQDLNKGLPKELNLPSNSHDIVEKISCDSSNQDCMNSKCNNCKLPEKIAESGAFETDNIKFDEWRQVDWRVRKFSVSIDVQEVSAFFNSHVRTLKRHIYVKRIQHAAFNNVKANLLEKKAILIQVYYSKNYINKVKVKCKVWQQSFLIFTACCQPKVDGVILNENFVMWCQIGQLP